MEAINKTKNWLRYNVKPHGFGGPLEADGFDPEAFHFGIEAEFILVDRRNFAPLWYPHLSFADLYGILESIPLFERADRGLKLEAPHGKALPYVVEGYHVTDAAMQPVDILPKGLEIRTPLADDLEECLRLLAKLYGALDQTLATHNYGLTSLSHHPTGMGFDGPQNKRRHDYWRWAVEAMHTFGPDINVGLPRSLAGKLCPEDLHQKVNYYAPAMTALSLNSPLLGGGLWQIDERTFGRSYRTFRRSVIAPAMELHPEQNGRMEYKTFEMSHDIADFRCYFLLWLTLLLEHEVLQGRDVAQSRIYGLGQVAVSGLESDLVCKKAAELLNAAHVILPQWGFDPAPLAHLARRLDNRVTPADAIIADVAAGMNVSAILQARSQLCDSTHCLDFGDPWVSCS